MSDFFQDLADVNVIRAVEDNISAQPPLMYIHMPGVTVYNEGGVLGIASKLPDSSLNAVFRARLKRVEVDSSIDKVLAIHKKSGRLPLIWIVTPTTQPQNLGNRLRSRGFKYVGSTPGMAVDIKAIVTPAFTPTELVIQRVKDERQLAAWLHPVSLSFDYKPEVVSAYYKMFASQGFGTELPWELYVGLVEGKPVASSRVFFAEGAAGIFHVATLPEARQRGYGTAMTLAALHAGKRRGFRVAILGAAKLGYRIYQRLGFWECCRAEFYAS